MGKTIKMTAVGHPLSGKRNLFMAFEEPRFQYVKDGWSNSLFDCFETVKMIGGEKIKIIMYTTPWNVSSFNNVFYRF